jgi:hypothetical protein
MPMKAQNNVNKLYYILCFPIQSALLEKTYWSVVAVTSFA